MSSKTVFRMLDVLGDLLRGGRHDRNKRKGAWPDVVDDPWNRKRRTNVHNARNNWKPQHRGVIYGVRRMFPGAS